MFDSITEGYKNLWKSIIRPQRDIYSDFELGPEVFSINAKNYRRTDFKIVSYQGNHVVCSHFEPVEEERKSETLPCVIYLHGNCGSRRECLGLIHYILPLGVTLVSFDYAGCGKSEGKYISLGYYEHFDLGILINFLKANRRIEKIALWGRSMGAVTAMLTAYKNFKVCGMVLDSPFSSMRKLSYEIAKKNIKLPKFILSIIYNLIRKKIEEKIGIDIDSINAIRFAHECIQPAFFITGKYDEFVMSHHSQDIYNEYLGEKDILYIEGDHNSIRPVECIEKAAKFLYDKAIKNEIEVKIKIDIKQIEKFSKKYNVFKDINNL